MKFAAHPWRKDLHTSIHHQTVGLSKGCGVHVGKGDLTSLGCLNLWVRRTDQRDVEDTKEVET